MNNAMIDFLETILFTKLPLGQGGEGFNLFDFISAFLLPSLAVYLSYRLLLGFLNKLIKKYTPLKKINIKTSGWIKNALRLVYVFIVISFGARLLGADFKEYFILFYKLLSRPFLEAGNTKISLVTVFLSVPVFYAASWISSAARTVTDTSLQKITHVDDSRKFSISGLVKYGVMTLAVILGLSMIGIDMSSIAVLFGVLGIGLGFGLQGLVGNFFAGVILLLAGYIKEGDRILHEGNEVEIIQIKLVSTIVRTLSNENIIIPNSSLVDRPVHNITYGDKAVYIKNTVQVAYGSDLEKVLAVLADIGKNYPLSDKERECRVRVNSFDSSGITVTLWTCITDSSERYKAVSEINMQIWRKFNENSIVIPFNQLDLHLKT
jgi:small-conductance mechanosensitive channel